MSEATRKVRLWLVDSDGEVVSETVETEVTATVELGYIRWSPLARVDLKATKDASGVRLATDAFEKDGFGVITLDLGPQTEQLWRDDTVTFNPEPRICECCGQEIRE